MKPLTSFLSKFTNLTPPERFVKEILISVATDVAGVTLTQDEIEVRGETLFITTAPTKKSELFMQKNLLLQRINQELKQYKKTIKDIR